MLASRTALRSRTDSPTKPKQPKKMAGRKKPTVKKSSSVTLTQMIGSSDAKHSETAVDNEYVLCLCFIFLFMIAFVIHEEESSVK